MVRGVRRAPGGMPKRKECARDEESGRKQVVP